VRRLKRLSELAIHFVLFPLGCLFIVLVAIGIGIQALAIYVGALLAAWTISAIGIPMLFGVIGPDELVDRIRNLRRSTRFFEGEPLPRLASDPEPAPFDPSDGREPARFDPGYGRIGLPVRAWNTFGHGSGAAEDS
jgi:hypothetical protein